MKQIVLFITMGFLLLLTACSQPSPEIRYKDFSAKEFQQKLLSEKRDFALLDVRTAEEYAKAHLENAVNWDWLEDSFESRVNAMPRNEPVYLYCLSGGRSSDAKDKLIEMGFEEVHQMSGGIMEWDTEKLPVVR